MKPTIGRIVHYYQGDREAFDVAHAGEEIGWEERLMQIELNRDLYIGTNGSRLHPAIVTQVRGDGCVNLTVFFADGKIEPRFGSVLLSEAAFSEGRHYMISGWRWPPAVER